MKRLVLAIKDEASDWLSVCGVDLHGIATNTTGVASRVWGLLCHLLPSACTEPVRSHRMRLGFHLAVFTGNLLLRLVGAQFRASIH